MPSRKESVEVSELSQDSGRPEGSYHVQALDRGLDILCRIAESPDGLPFESIMKAAGLSKATAFRLIWNLERRGFVKRSHHGGYAIGHKVLDLADAYQRQFPLAEIAMPHLRKLRDETLETTGLMVRHEASRVCIMCLDSPQSVRRTLKVGNMGPLYRGAAGRILLAHLPRSEREKSLADVERIEFADGSSISRAEFLKELADIKEAGSALSHMDSAADLWAVAAPVRDRVGDVMAAIACTGPVNRFDEEHLEHCRQKTLATAKRLSLELGWSGEDRG